MFHLAAYRNAALGNVADTDISAVVDDILAIQNNHFVLNQDMDLIAIFAGSATILRTKLASPSARQIAAPFIRPVNGAALPGNNANISLLMDRPYRIRRNEEIQVQATSGVAMTEAFHALLWLARSVDPAPPGNITALRWTSTTAAVAGSWTTITATFTDSIPSGTYVAVGTEHFSTNAIAHRLIFSNQDLRPGMLSTVSATQRLPYAADLRQFGVLGYFKSNDLPRIQVLANAADATHEGYIDCIKVSDNV